MTLPRLLNGTRRRPVTLETFVAPPKLRGTVYLCEEFAQGGVYIDQSGRVRPDHALSGTLEVLEPVSRRRRSSSSSARPRVSRKRKYDEEAWEDTEETATEDELYEDEDEDEFEELQEAAAGQSAAAVPKALLELQEEAARHTQWVEAQRERRAIDRRASQYQSRLEKLLSRWLSSEFNLQGVPGTLYTATHFRSAEPSCCVYFHDRQRVIAFDLDLHSWHFVCRHCRTTLTGPSAMEEHGRHAAHQVCWMDAALFQGVLRRADKHTEKSHEHSESEEERSADEEPDEDDLAFIAPEGDCS